MGLKKAIMTAYTKYDNQLFFGITVERDPTLKSDVIIRLTAPNLGMPLYYYSLNVRHPIVLAYKRILADTVTLLDSVVSYDSLKYVEPLFLLEKTMANATPTHEIQETTKNQYRIVTMERLKNSARNIPIHDILSDYFNEVHITPSTRIWVPHGDYFERLSDRLVLFDKIELMNSITLSTLMKFAPFGGRKFNYGVKNYMTILTGRDYINKPQWEFCSGLVYDLVPMGFVGLIQREANRARYDLNRSIVDDMYANIKQYFIKSVHRSRMNNTWKRSVIERANSIPIQIGLPNYVCDSGFADRFHYELQIIYDNLHQNILNAKRFKRLKMQALLNGENIMDQSFYWTILNTFEVIYRGVENAIIVPQYLVNLPHYHQDYAIAILYGRLGVMIAEALSNAIHNFYGFFQFDKYFPGYIIGANMTSERLIYECIKNTSIYSNHRIYDTNYRMNSSEVKNLTLYNTLTHLNAVKLAAHGLKYNMDSNPHRKRPEHISGLEKYELHEIFYLSYAQSQCSLDSQELNDWRDVTQFKLSPKDLLKLTWLQSLEFFSAFICPVSSTTNKTCINLMF